MYQHGVDVVLPTYGARVPEPLGHRVERPDDVPVRFPTARRRPHGPQLNSGHHRASPGAEILGRDVATGDSPKVGVHIVRRNGLTLPGRVEVLEQFLTRQVLAPLDDASEPGFGDGHGVFDPALTPEAESQQVACDLHVPPAQSRQPKGAIFAGVFVLAHTNERLVQQPHHGGEDLAPGQVAGAKIALHAFPENREDLAELEHAAKLRPVTRFAVRGMVAILLPAAGVARRGRDRADGIRANPHVSPGRRDRQRVEPFLAARVTDARTDRGVVAPTLPGTAPTDAGQAVRDVVESGAGRCFAKLMALFTTHRSPRCRLGTDLARPD